MPCRTRGMNFVPEPRIIHFTGNSVPSAPSCNGDGTNECGVCACNDGFTGKACECDLNEASSGGGAGGDIDANCKDPNSPNVVCNGRGTCFCGICTCDGAPDVRYVKYGIMQCISLDFPSSIIQHVKLQK